MARHDLIILLVGFVVAGNSLRLFADDSTSLSPGSIASMRPLSLDDDDDDEKKSSQATGRYLFGLLDHRSSYGQNFFHDPFFGPEFDSEKQIELEYTHGEGRGLRSDEVDASFQWNIIGQLNIAGEFGWESMHADDNQAGTENDNSDLGTARGFEDVDLAVYHPLFQYVSKDEMLDYTAIGRLDISLPTRTAVSGKDVQLTPYLGHLLRIGKHLSIEAWTGAQFTIAPHQSDQLIYGTSFGWVLFRDELPIIESFTPIFELDGQAPLSGNGQDALFGFAGFEIDFKSKGRAEPQIQIGYQFPIDQGARDELRWGVTIQMFFGF